MPKFPCIPTLHPAAIMRDQTLLPVAINDLRKTLSIPPEEYNLYPSLPDVKAFTATEFAFDIETAYWNSGSPQITMVGLCAAPYKAIVVPFTGAYKTELQRIFRDATAVIGHNCLQFDLPILQDHGVELAADCTVWDTMLLQHLRFPDLPHDLEFVGSQFSNKPAWKSDKAVFELYNARDVDVTLQCYRALRPMCKAAGLEDLYLNVQVPLARICKLMSDTGFTINPNKIGEVREKLLAEMKREELLLPEFLRTRQVAVKKRQPAPPGTLGKSGKPVKFIMVEGTEEETPWRSAKEIEKYLYTTLALPVQNDLKTDRVTTGKMALDKLYRRTKDRSLLALKKLRQMNSLVTLFCKEQMLDIDKMHPHFNVHGTASGRLSSSDPNLQNVPESARYIYVPSHPGWKIIDVDYSQIENRLTAYFANDTERMERFIRDPKFSEHKFAASLFLGCAYDEVEKDNDKEAPYGKAKRIVHGCVTGDHEVLTEAGWVRFDQYDFKTPIAEWDADTQLIAFNSPLDSVAAPWEGNLEVFAGRAFAARTTPDHAFPARKGTAYYKRTAAEALDKNHRLPLTGFLSFGSPGLAGDVRLAAAVQADGTLYGNHAVFHLHRKRKIERLEQLLLNGDKTTWNYAITDCGCGGKRISFPYTPHAILTNKEFNSLVLALSHEKALELLEEVLFWDGHVRVGGRRKEFVTTSRESAIWIQTLAHCHGREALLRERPLTKGHFGTKPVWVVSFNNRREARVASLAKRRKQAYKGLVYCVTTKTGYFLCRYRDRIFVSGNTNYGMGARKISLMYDMDFKDIKALQDKWKNAIYRTIQWQNVTGEQAKKQGYLTTPFGRKRWFYTSSYFTEALSFLPQSTAADCIFRAMIALMYERIGWPLHSVSQIVQYVEPLPQPAALLLQVHDSLVLECPSEMVDKVVGVVSRVMTQPWPELGGLSIPIGVKVGDSWGECE